MTKAREFDCRFRPARLSDQDRLSQLIEECWVEVYRKHLPEAAVRAVREGDLIKTHVDAYWSASEVAEVNGRVVGVITVAEDWVFSLNVDKLFRRSRIGSCLMLNALRRGGRRLEVAAFNGIAISFYRSLGWVRVGESAEAFGGCIVPTVMMHFRPQSSS